MVENWERTYSKFFWAIISFTIAAVALLIISSLADAYKQGTLLSSVLPHLKYFGSLIVLSSIFSFVVRRSTRLRKWFLRSGINRFIFYAGYWIAICLASGWIARLQLPLVLETIVGGLFMAAGWAYYEGIPTEDTRDHTP